MQAFRDAAASGNIRQTVTYTHGHTTQAQRVEDTRVLVDTLDQRVCVPLFALPQAKDAKAPGRRLVHCLCTPDNAAPRVLPWVERAEFDAHAVDGVGLLFRQHTPAKMQSMAPYFGEMCIKHGITTEAATRTLAALSMFVRNPDVAKGVDSTLRYKALCVALEMHGKCATRNADHFVAEGRMLDWTRLISFVGESGLALLVTSGVTGTAACATYLAAQYAAGQMAVYKSTFCLVTKLSSPILAVGAGAGAVVLGAATTACAVGSVSYYAAVIHAFRDVWDHEAARDAMLLHRLRDHGGATKPDAAPCRHYNSDAWTGPGDSLAHTWRGGRGN